MKEQKHKSILTQAFKGFVLTTFIIIEIMGLAYGYFYYKAENKRIIMQYQEINASQEVLELRLAEHKQNSILRFVIFTIVVCFTGIISNEIYQRQFKRMQDSFDDFSMHLSHAMMHHVPLQLNDELQYSEFVSVSNSLNQVLEEINNSKNYNSLTKLPKTNKFLKDITRLNALSSRQIIVCYIYFKRYEKIIINKGLEGANRVILEFTKEIQKINEELEDSKIGKISGNGDFLFAFPCLVTPSYCIETTSVKLHEAFKNAMKVSGETVYEQNLGLGFDILQDYGKQEQHRESLSNAYRAALLASEQENVLYFTYSHELREEIQHGVVLEQDLKKALDEESLKVFYQGKVGADDDKLKGAEALVRWRRNNKFENTEVFIKIAEKTDMIIKLERFVINTVLKTQRMLQDRNIFFPISINISAKHLSSPEFLVFLKEKVKEYKIDPKYVEIEIIEREKLNSDNIDILKEIKSSGFSISIDDFGKDYSSLSYISSLPIDCIKIDKSFIDGLDEKSGQEINESSKAIIGGIIKIAKSINKIVVAEGVETLEQIKSLRQLGCDQLQGYYFHFGASPMDEFLQVYQSRL